MIEQRWMFDSDGEVFPNPDPYVVAPFSSEIGLSDFLEYAVINLGFVVAFNQRDTLHIRLRRKKVSPVALSSLFYFLTGQPNSKLVLSIFDTEWRHQIIGQRKLLWDQLGALSKEQSETAQDRFLSQSVGLSNLEEHDPQGILFRTWCQGSDRCPHEVLGQVDALFDGRFTLARVAPSSELVIERTGDGYVSYNSAYLKASRGTRFQDEPDTEYGQWVLDKTSAVYRNFHPLAEDVDALIGCQSNQRRRVRYRRIILPFSDPSGGDYLVTASTLMPDIDLRRAVS